MGGISQNLKAVITFGGNLDNSWKRSADGLQKSLKDVGKQSERLTKDQTRLAAEIKRAKLAGESLGDLKRRYTDVSREIRKTEAEQQKLNVQMQKAQRIQAFKGAGKGLFRRGLGIAGQVGGMFGSGLAIGGGGVVASALGTLIAPAATNAETATRTNVAKSYGVDVATFNAWDSLAKQYDMNAENIGDLFEEYLHKSGEYKQNGKQGSLQDAFETLGFKAGDFAGLSDMAQFDKIVERALSLQDESKASFALDSLFGGEASKLLMLIKQSGRSYRDLMDEQRRYNLVTKEGADGAVAGNQAINNLRTVFSSAVAEISGQLGNELAPDIRNLTNDLADWFKGGGIKRIVTFLRNDLYPGVLSFGQGVVFVGKIIYALAKKLSWLLPDERNDQRDVLKTLAGNGMNMARLRAEQTGQGEWFSQQLATHPDLPEKVKESWNDTRGWFGPDSDDEAFNKSLDKYLSPEGGDSLLNWNAALQQNKDHVAQTVKEEPESSAGAWDNYAHEPVTSASQWEREPSVLTYSQGEGESARAGDKYPNAPLFPAGQQDRNVTATDSSPAEPVILKDESTGGYWESLLQKMDVLDKQPPSRQITDNRKFEYHFEINAAPGQDEKAIADEVTTVTKNNSAFNGDNSLLDGGLVW
ncbi:hypothetical protein K9B91_003285 [Salmonella enterica subsp. enterica serovar Give]|uniref:Phage tail tape measure protein n=3 Tax=Salmonella enterica I TaxID=59201 RepID=A0A728SV50_SALDE|nr:hypothetical protein [Salmonella enterica]EAA5201941.1 hypothetical protein [Salmonella enterica subsp. enterica serovar Muenster]EAM4448356.1 hypothetical protein [Salmonella enterica subsp. enterica serovar Infantis]EAP4146836.1 hypothetical protein [Salmonella enterica subsp. enterica serovar Anatum]EAW2463763.1 hypothetical protein [Salmonella enterica subsp. enterica]EBU6930454.1 hypothetical protein [Salmonella enterica subsp. enterica serovar Sandiego]EBV1754679.1 hypothetical prote